MMKRKNYYLPQPLLTKLAKRAKREGVSQSELVRKALEQFLK